MTSPDCYKKNRNEKLYHDKNKGTQVKCNSVHIDCENIKNFLNPNVVKVIIGANAIYSSSLNTMANTFGKPFDAHAWHLVPNIFAKPSYIFNSNLNPSAAIFIPNFHVDSIIKYMIFNQFFTPHLCTQKYSLNPNAECFIPRVSINPVLQTDDLNRKQIWNNLRGITSTLNVKAKVFKPTSDNYLRCGYLSQAVL